MIEISKFRQVLIATGLIIGLVGCGSGGSDVPMGTISGQVTFGGEPLTTGLVTFSNSELGSGASAELDESGRYEVAAPMKAGEYRVIIQPPPPPAPHEMDQAPAKAPANFPPMYQSFETSGLTATIEEGSNSKDFQLR